MRAADRRHLLAAVQTQGVGAVAEADFGSFFTQFLAGFEQEDGVGPLPAIDPQSDFDWASDSKPEKETGRVMMRMTNLIIFVGVLRSGGDTRFAFTDRAAGCGSANTGTVGLRPYAISV